MRRWLHAMTAIVETVAGAALVWACVDAVVQARRWLRSQRAVDVAAALEAASKT